MALAVLYSLPEGMELGRKSREKRDRREQPQLNVNDPPANSRRAVFRAVKAAVVGIARAPGLAATMRSGQPAAQGTQLQYSVFGSGVIVDGTGLIATAKHVVQKWVDATQAATKAGGDPPEPLFAVLTERYGSDEKSVGGEFLISQINFVRLHTKLDLALLRVGAPNDKVNRFPTLAFASTPCEDADEIAVCGFPLGSDMDRLHGAVPFTPTFSRGIVSAALPYFGAP